MRTFTAKFFHGFRAYVWALALLVAAHSVGLRAQDEPGTLQPEPEPAQLLPQASDPIAMIREAYGLTEKAASEAEFTKIATLCEAAAAAPGVAAENSKYARELAAWALNKRGEKRLDNAGELIAQGNGEQAEALFAEALADFEKSVTLDATRWKAIHNRGVSLAQAGQFERALADFSRTIELQSSYGNAWFNRGEVYYALGKYTEAIRDYDQALARLPGDLGAYTSRGHAYFQLGMLAGDPTTARRYFIASLDDYNQTVNVDPNNPASYANRADAYRSLASWERAARDYRQAIALDENNAQALHGAAWLMSTCPDENFRDADLAVEAAEKALKINGDSDFRYLDTLAAAYANAGRFEDAVSTIEKAMAKAPAEQTNELQRRKVLYSQQKPFRQGQGEAAAGN